MINMCAKEEAKAVAKPIIQGCVPDIVAMGTIIGPIADTAAPSLMKLVAIPVNRLVAMASPSPLRRNSGNRTVKLSAR